MAALDKVSSAPEVTAREKKAGKRAQLAVRLADVGIAEPDGAAPRTRWGQEPSPHELLLMRELQRRGDWRMANAGAASEPESLGWALGWGLG